jgi:serine/threonine protein kinase
MATDWLSIDQGATQRFQILGEIARGRMGVVCRVCDHALGRKLACKIPAGTSLADPDAKRRFGDHVRIIAQLQHPGIPPVFDVGILHDGRPFMMMKLVTGSRLDAILKEQIQWTSERQRLVQVFQQVCRTLAYTHFRGIMHRDVQPANVMIGEFGEIQILGWGLAVVIPKEGSAPFPVEDARRGAVFGNPAYMAPEQARGEATDFRADVFGLGALLCHMLTGRPPFLGENVAAVARSAANAELGDAISRLDKCGGDKELVAMAMQCLRPSREDRPSDATEVARRLAMT